MSPPEAPAIRSLVFATDIDVLSSDKVLARRDGYWKVHCPGNPTFWWGNFLLFDDPPQPGDGKRWPALFEAEFAGVPQLRHQAFAWDRTDDARGAAQTEFQAPYELELLAGLVAAAGELHPHPRANGEVQVRALDPQPGADEELWQAVLAVHRAQNAASEHPIDPELQEHFWNRRIEELRVTFRAGHGAWYLALLDGEAAGSLGIVVTDGRARYQSVDTLPAHRGKGIASRLVYEAAQLAAAQQRIDNYVIVADPGYHAIGIYESLGFKLAERACGVVLRPGAQR